MLLSGRYHNERNYSANEVRLDESWERQEGGGSMNSQVSYAVVSSPWIEPQELGFGVTEEDMARREGQIYGVRGP